MSGTARLYTTGEVARQIGVSTTTLRKYVREGLIKADVELPSGYLKFSQETVDDFMKKIKCKGDNENE